MRGFRIQAIGLMPGLSVAVHAQTSTDLRGIYVSGTDFPVSKQVAAALFQFNVVIPTNAPDGDQPISAFYGGSVTAPPTLLNIQH